MDKKYKVVSASSVFPLVVKLKRQDQEDSNMIEINVRIDYQNDKVYFDEVSQNLGPDLISLEQQILEYFKPPHVDIPDVFYENFSKIQEVRQANYASSFADSYTRRTPETTEETNDSRQS